MKKVLLSAVCVLMLAGVSMADTLYATDMAGLQPGSPDTNYAVGAEVQMCNYPVLIYRFDMTGVIAATGSDADAGNLQLTGKWAEDPAWEFKAIGTSADFAEATVTWNSHTGSAADMGYWDAMTPESQGPYPAFGNWGPPGDWPISEAMVQSWIDGGGIATVALVRASDYYNTCHWTTNGWDGGQLPRLTVTTTPEPATLVVIALGGLAVLRRRR